MTRKFCRYMMIAITLAAAYAAAGQDKIRFFENITPDSVMIFFNRNNQLVKKECADFTRYIRLSTKGAYHGVFYDVDTAHNVVGKGKYDNGSKDGYFELYYPNGKAQSHGNYVHNIPDGKWEFFYENGLPERTLILSPHDTLVYRYVTPKGEISISEGNGSFEGLVGGATIKVAKGKMRDGRPDGKWISGTYCKEEFKEGKFIKGTLTSINPIYASYSLSEIDNFFITNYIERLEGANAVICDKSYAGLLEKVKAKNANGKKSLNKLDGDLRPKIDRLLENDFKSGNISDYVTGDNKLLIQFATDKEGKPFDFVCLSPWGCRMLYPISNSIRLHMTFPPNRKMMYFQLKLHYPGGSVYSYGYGFSSSSSF